MIHPLPNQEIKEGGLLNHQDKRNKIFKKMKYQVSQKHISQITQKTIKLP
ncbi:MAG: hypothetical protein BTN85_1639 [Candidatus Methanohalarchaeum thermophilum]|uniref:Uncharacterized protein n=1 Tax=Methanohalarchaeum thermophilum TaxID=1903181 RepID=A0A1Q6DXU2_METT1|nr:MAG: hypothetical protein BTN85_1639 [Candidatus Methanohalarchaeum thermophilum]